MDRGQRAVDIQDDPRAGIGPAVLSPHPGADLTERFVDPVGRPRRLGEVGDHPPESGVRPDIAKHTLGRVEHRKVGAAVTADVQHQQAVNQQSAAVHHRDTRPQIGHRTSEPDSQTKPVRVPRQRSETGQSDDLVGLLVAVISHGK